MRKLVENWSTMKIWARYHIHLRRSAYFSGRSSSIKNSLGRFYSVDTSTQSRLNIKHHIPVMVSQVLTHVEPKNCEIILDATFGSGGHARKLLKCNKNLKLFCLDRDPEAFARAVELQDEYPDRVVPLHGKFSDLPHLLKEKGVTQNSLDAILFDFGVSSTQFDNPARGFSLRLDGPLDMRMDGVGCNEPTGADVLAYATEIDLSSIFRKYGCEVRGKKIARAILETRQSYGNLKRTGQFRDVVAQAFGSEYSPEKYGKFNNVATLAFVALRAFVNNEPNEIDYAMAVAQLYLKYGGRLVTITYNVYEDTIVKNHITGINTERVHSQIPLSFYNFNKTYEFQELTSLDHLKWTPLTQHVIKPSREEVDYNPRSKNAKLRIALKRKN